MKIKEIALEVASVALVEFESGSNTLAIIRKEKFTGGLSDAAHWAGAVSALMQLAIESIPERDQNEFEEILYAKIKEAMARGAEMVIQGEVGEEMH